VYDCDASHAVAMLLWAREVGSKSEWDHKDTIKTRFPSRATGRHQSGHLYGDYTYSVEIWSNIHSMDMSAWPPDSPSRS